MVQSNIDTTVLVSSKASSTEETQQCYIAALEKRISALEEQLKCPEATDLKLSRPTVEASKLLQKKDTVKFRAHLKSLKDVACLQPFSKFFGRAKVVARRCLELKGLMGMHSQGVDEIVCDFQVNYVQDSENEAVADGARQDERTIPPVIFSLDVSEDGGILRANAKINDPQLMALIKVFFAHYPGLGPHAADISIDSPFEPFIQHWGVLQALVKWDEGDDTIVAFKDRLNKLKKSWKGEAEWQRQLQKLLSDPVDIERMKKNLGTLLELILEAAKAKGGDQSLIKALEENSQQELDVISFENLWAIFKPGDIVMSRLVMDEWQAFVVRESMESGKTISPNKTMHWKLFCWTYDWTGTTFRRVSVQLQIDFFKGTKQVRLLPVIPRKYMSDKTEELLERGRRFREICLKAKGSRLFLYSGDAILRGTGIGQVKPTPGLSDDMDTKGDPISLATIMLGNLLAGQDFSSTSVVEIDGDEQVMIDVSSFTRHGPGKHYRNKHLRPMGKVKFCDKRAECNCYLCSNSALMENQKLQYDLDTSQSEKEFEDETQYLICPPRVLGYHLSKKRWMEFKVREVKDIKQMAYSEAFESLEHPRRSKDLLKKLVLSHWGNQGSDRRKMEDIVKGKGESLVILLYGPPGVGKTLTAESVAQLSGKPLLVVGVADIGLKPENVEENFHDVFSLAASWEAIILFDEADVFLEARSSGESANLERNSLVVELLKVLEYYNGILILTTNRLRSFDHAVMSRINLPMKYEQLTDNHKKTIFLNFINQLDEDATMDLEEIKDWIEEEDTMELLKDLNGRQIRNILFSAARMTSEQEDGKLMLDNIKVLAEVIKRFAVDVKADMEAARARNEPRYPC